MTYQEYLFLVQRCHFALLLPAAGLVAFGHAALALPVLAAAILLPWRLCRCPNCGCSLDLRIPQEELRHCPACGEDLTRRPAPRWFRRRGSGKEGQETQETED